MSETNNKYRQAMQRGLPEVAGLVWHEGWQMFVSFEPGGDRPVPADEAEARIVAHAKRNGAKGETLDEIVTDLEKR